MSSFLSCSIVHVRIHVSLSNPTYTTTGTVLSNEVAEMI